MSNSSEKSSGCGQQIALIGLIASLITIYGFLTDKTNIEEILRTSVSTVMATPTVKHIASEPQWVQWILDYNNLGPGICINQSDDKESCDNFLEWDLLVNELSKDVLPKTPEISGNVKIIKKDWVDPEDGTLKKDWIVKIVDSNGQKVGDVWQGGDPEKDWR